MWHICCREAWQVAVPKLLWDFWLYYIINSVKALNTVNRTADVGPVEQIAFLMWGQVKPISSRGVAISMVLLWTVGGDGDRVRTGPTDRQHNTGQLCHYN